MHGLSAIAREINASMAVKDKRLENQLKENAERERKLPEFRASEAEKDCQHETRMEQLLMSLKILHLLPHYERCSSMHPFSTRGGLHNVSQPNSLMFSYHFRCSHGCLARDD